MARNEAFIEKPDKGASRAERRLAQNGFTGDPADAAEYNRRLLARVDDFEITDQGRYGYSGYGRQRSNGPGHERAREKGEFTFTRLVGGKLVEMTVSVGGGESVEDDQK